ncbi:AOAH-like protein [Mya arenaria]|uniref:AOAH-like protein n=1 Tax=Mya arenaria TaxID=6604 RepID=A0ABY7ESF8_MYAAR|nr:AOAH-like protein [Mya arenaria]
MDDENSGCRRVEDRDTPDVICSKLGLCTAETGPQCTLFPLKPGTKLHHYSQDPVLVQKTKHLDMTLRGYSWRGKDCDDRLTGVHPGARTINDDINMDSNCNGVKISPCTGWMNTNQTLRDLTTQRLWICEFFQSRLRELHNFPFTWIANCLDII